MIDRELVLNDCPPITDAERRAVSAAIAGADSFREYTWSRDGQPPIISWDEDFDRLIEKRTGIISDLARKGICTYPWAAMDAAPAKRKKSNIFYWNQGGTPSCSMHAAVHAIQGAIITEMALGASIDYDALNPIYPFFIARGGNMFGGISIYETAETINKTGMVSVSEVGANNIDPPRDAYAHAEQSAKRQGAIIYIDSDYTDKIFRAAAAGLYVVFGSYTIYTGAKIDANGVKIGGRTTRGGHAQSFGSWRKRGGEEYIFITNSHGEIYEGGSEGDPLNGCWLTRGQVDLVADSFDTFGPPFIVLPEDPDSSRPTLLPEFAPDFPQGFKRK